jgi:energy-coupling factor transporter transmembrane protein EcfT
MHIDANITHIQHTCNIHVTYTQTTCYINAAVAAARLRVWSCIVVACVTHFLPAFIFHVFCISKVLLDQVLSILLVFLILVLVLVFGLVSYSGSLFPAPCLGDQHIYTTTKNWLLQDSICFAYTHFLCIRVSCVICTCNSKGMVRYSTSSATQHRRLLNIINLVHN